MATEADKLAAGDRAAAERLGTRLIVTRIDNLVERPWGGTRLREFKRLGLETPGSGSRFGESFEIAADDADAEARRYASVVDLPDGSSVRLSALLEQHAETLLGEDWVLRFGRRYPLLPKLLDIGELLSVQAHPPGNTEVYVIVEAEPGATIRVGFGRDVDSNELAQRLAEGRGEQQNLQDLCRGTSPDALQNAVQPWLAQRAAEPAEIVEAIAPRGAAREEIEASLRKLRAVYWEMLDSLNEIPVTPGQVIYNANPPRITSLYDRPASAEIHALGNPEGRALLALEIRRPGPTFRAWDNVRFPLRDVDTAAALMAVNLTKTAEEEFVVERKATRTGVERSVSCEYFRIEHLMPTPLLSVEVPGAGGAHSLHVLSGAVSVFATDGERVGVLGRGASALVPVGVGTYRIAADEMPVHVVKVDLPPYAD